MAQDDIVLEFIETLESLRNYRRAFFCRAVPIRYNAMRLLMLLHYQGGSGPGMQPSELGDILKLTRPAITSLVNSLEQLELVERIPAADDRRVVFVRATEQGSALVRQTKEKFATGIGEMMDYLDQDGPELMRILRRVRQYLAEKEEGENGPCGS